VTVKLPRALTRLSTLQRALCLSLALHLLLLAVRFADPQRLGSLLRGEGLPVILLNVRPDEAPEKAQAIAQSASAGGGDAASGRATSPLPYAALTEVGDKLQAPQERIAALQAQQAQLLAHLRQQIAALPPIQMLETRSPQEALQAQQEREQLLKMIAEIEERINAENARPKKRYISPATKEAVYATYYDQMRSAIEAKGNANFPEHQGQKLYGELVMLLTINHDGQLLGSEVLQTSGNPTLDRQAQAIASAAAPYGLFTPELRERSDQIAIVSRFTFTRKHSLGISTVQ